MAFPGRRKESEAGPLVDPLARFTGRTLRIGARGSELALRQAELAANALRRFAPSLAIDVVPIRTTGDKQAQTSLSEIGGRGVFVKELETALRRGEVDLAVHSLKDVPSSELADGLRLAAVLPRETPNDTLVARNRATLAALPAGARVGTGSSRRAAQLAALRSDLRIVDIRGNVGTRIRKVKEGDVDAVVLAAAGLARLSQLDAAGEILALDVMLPAVGQGIIALETRAADPMANPLAEGVNDPETFAVALCERAFQRRLGAGCQAAVAGLAEFRDGILYLRGMVADIAGQTFVRGEILGPSAEAKELGRELAEELLARGAADLLGDQV